MIVDKIKMKMKNVAPLLLFLIICSIISASFIAQSVSSFNQEGATLEDEVNNAIKGLDYDNIKVHVKALSALATRVPGYPDYYKAVVYISSTLRGYGLRPVVQNYSAVMPIDEGSYIKVISPRPMKIKAYALWPNDVQTCMTPPEGIRGKLVYVGRGDLRELRGVDLFGSIALMDFNSMDNWVKLAELGVKAFVFMEPPATDSVESFLKSIPVPAYIPRLYVKAEDARVLKELADENAVVELHVNMRWKEIQASNIMVSINGTEHPDEVIVVSAHYDSWSIVPGIAPGAEDAVSVSLLMELARYFAEHRPSRSLWLVALSGYYQFLTGPAEWVEMNYFSDEVQSGKVKILLHLDVDLSSEDTGIDLLYTSWPLWLGADAQSGSRYNWISQRINYYASIALGSTGQIVSERFVNPTFLIDQRWGRQPYMRDYGGSWAEWLYIPTVQVSFQTGILGITLRTQWARRLNWFTPLNDYEFINWSNIKEQAKLVTAIIAGFAYESDWKTEIRTPTRFSLALQYGAMPFGYVTLEGKVMEFNISKGWYAPVPNALVRIWWGGTESRYLGWQFLCRYTFADENGHFTFHGLHPYRQAWLDAWKFNETTGRIIYTVDSGMYGTAQQMAGGIRADILPVTHPASILLPVFRCEEVTVFGLIDIRLLRHQQVPYAAPAYSFMVYDYDTKSEPIFYRTWLARSFGVGMAFVKKGKRITLTFNPNIGELRRPIFVLTNSTEDNPEGYGFLVKGPLTIYRTTYRAAKDLYYICKGRYSTLRNYYIINPSVDELLKEAKRYLDLAEACFANKTWDLAYAYSLVAMSLSEVNYYSGVMPLYDEASVFLLFYALTAIMFAVFFERLVLHQIGAKRVLGIGIMLFATFAVLGWLTPLFAVLQSSLVAIMGVGLFILGMFIVTVLSSEVREVIERGAELRLGRHIVRTEKVAAMMHALGTAVDNMRRRPLSTVLTLLTIIVFVAAQTAFTSASYKITLSYSPVSQCNLPYNGLEIRRLYGMPPDTYRGGCTDTPVINYLMAFVSDDYLISPRVWLYPTSVYPYGVTAFVVGPTGRSVQMSPLVFLGMTSEEAKLLFKNCLVSGFINFIRPTDCLVPDTLARTLNITIGDNIYVKGLDINLTVVGIITSPGMLYDFNGRPLLPADPAQSPTVFHLPTAYREENPPSPVSIDNLIVIPWLTAYKLGGFISSVALLPKHNVTMNEVAQLAERIAMGIDIPVYIKHNDVFYGASRLVTYSFAGWNFMAILLVLACLSIANSMIANTQRRRREIYVYSAVGLSPAGATLMFITEALTYATLGLVLGYLLGYGITAMLIRTTPTAFMLSFNMSSLFVLISLGAIMLTILGTALYPSIVAPAF